MNGLYQHELRLHKNSYWSVIKLRSKERIGGNAKTRYEAAKTPYERLIESDQISQETKEGLKGIYLSR
jgi:hypothetical protein